MQKNILFLAIISVLFASCSTAKVYTKPNVVAYTAKHRTLAIMPPKITVLPSKYKPLEERLEMEQLLPATKQEDISQQLLVFVQKGKLFIEIEDVNRTNRKLLEIGYFDENGVSMPPEELAAALGIDALLYSDWTLVHYKDNPGLFIALGILQPYLLPLAIIGAISASKNVLEKNQVVFKLYDGKTGDMIWQYSDGQFGNYKRLCKKSPYYRK